MILSIREQERADLRIAIDTGGTFTDCVCLEDGKLRVKKIFSSPADPSRAVLEGVRHLAAQTMSKCAMERPSAQTRCSSGPARAWRL